jgi:hypothetical protein
MTRITITLDDQESAGLQSLAEREFRGPLSQAAFIIHKELEKQGLITVPDPPAPTAPPAAVSTETPTQNKD